MSNSAVNSVDYFRLMGHAHRPNKPPMTKDRPVFLMSEPTNKFDPNAIKVVDAETGIPLGYVPAQKTAEWKPRLKSIQRAYLGPEEHTTKQGVKVPYYEVYVHYASDSTQG